MPQATTKTVDFPEDLAALFWEYDWSNLDWDEHRDFIVGRVLSHGTWDQLCWLRETVGDEAIRNIVLDTKGRNLTPKQLRFWQLIVDLPAEQVDAWLKAPERQVWDRRVP